MPARPGHEDAGSLAHAVESLDATTRLVLALLHVERLTVEETALALGLEVSQVDRAATRARALLLARAPETLDGRAA